MSLRAPRLSRRRLLGAGLAIAAGATGLNCRGSAPKRGSAGAARPKRLTLSWWTDTGFPSPFAFSTLGPGGIVRVSLLFDSLVWKDEHGLIPWLAESWTVQDGGRTILFKIRPGVIWHDGQPLDARDVEFSFSYFATHSFAWADTSVVESATATDAASVAIRLNQPFAPFLHDIAGVLPIIPRHVWSGVGDPLTFQGPGATLGSGPFILESYREGQGAYLFRANDRYFAGRPAFDELAYELVPAAQQPLRLRQGAIDGALSMDYDVQAGFRSGRYRVLPTQPFSIVRLTFNVDRPPFDKPAFRQAIGFALDRAQIAQRVMHGDVIVGSAGVIPPESPWYSAKVAQYPYDPARAGSLLDGLGYQRKAAGQLRQSASGAPLRIQLLTDPNAPEAELIQSMLGQAGIGVDLAGADPKTRTDRLQKLDYQMGLLGHIGVGGDPDFLRLWYAGKTSNGFAQGNVLHDARFNELAAQQAGELDENRRRALVAEMQATLADDLPTLPLYHRRFYWIYNPAASDRWFNTSAGIMNGIPLADNKLSLLQR
jgi:peptide/nickel transport system substrate-binding protein